MRIPRAALPAHLHGIGSLPEGDGDFSTRWRLIKILFAKCLPKTEWRSDVRAQRGKHGIRQRRYWEHAIRDDHDYAAHMDCLHFNSVRHGYVARVADGPFSTFNRCVAQGICPLDWTGGAHEAMAAGEPID